MAKWKPISTAPRDGSHVLLAIANDPPGFVAEGYYEEDDDRGWFAANTHWTDASDGRLYPSHWMPLPDPPRMTHTDTPRQRSTTMTAFGGPRKYPREIRAIHRDLPVSRRGDRGPPKESLD